MAKLSASEAATLCSHQVRKLHHEDCVTILEKASRQLSYIVYLHFKSGDPGSRWDGLRGGHACREALP